jgi:ERCC4-type nuclease
MKKQENGLNNLIIVDTREKGHKAILKHFEKVGQDYIVSKLDYGDYMFYKNNNVVIDRKDSLLELAGNLCHTSEHERVKREIARAKEDGVKEFIFLISETKIKTVEDIKNWSSPHTKVKGSVLLKIMSTMAKKYGVKFIVCKRRDMGKKIIELLGGKNG